jgi:hypothetical protein
MQKATQGGSNPNTFGNWVINILWIILWIVIQFLVVDVFGAVATYITLLVTIVGGILIWYYTARRDRLNNAN